MTGATGFARDDRVLLVATAEAPANGGRLRAGITGTVDTVDALGTVHVRWDDFYRTPNPGEPQGAWVLETHLVRGVHLAGSDRLQLLEQPSRSVGVTVTYYGRTGKQVARWSSVFPVPRGAGFFSTAVTVPHDLTSVTEQPFDPATP